MSNRIVNDPAAAGWELDTNTGYWMWTASGGASYDDTELRGLISDNSDRITALEGATVDAYTKAESDAKYVPKVGDTTISGTLTANNLVATG